jgi:hypothetical protein
MHTQFRSENLKEKDRLRDLGVLGKIILSVVLKV